jgi:hypothetical protein
MTNRENKKAGWPVFIGFFAIRVALNKEFFCFLLRLRINIVSFL